MDMSAWAHRHFWGAAVGDLRLLRRLVEVASCIRRNLRGTLPDGMARKPLIGCWVILEKTIGRPESGWTNASAMRAIARMGGYLGRKHDGPPGWLSIWRGWLQLMLLLDGYLIALGQKTYG